jgi:glutamate 5-kinase
VAQILLTGDDIELPEKKNNLQNTFEALLEMGVIPIVYENDSVSFSEIESSDHRIFGDNDTLSATVAVLTRAKTLVLLSDIDGLYESDPKTDPGARLIREIREIDDEITAKAGGVGTSRGTGGMITKLSAARLAMESGVDMIITNGARPEELYDIVGGRPCGTLFIGRGAK